MFDRVRKYLAKIEKKANKSTAMSKRASCRPANTRGAARTRAIMVRLPVPLGMGSDLMERKILRLSQSNSRPRHALSWRWDGRQSAGPNERPRPGRQGQTRCRDCG